MTDYKTFLKEEFEGQEIQVHQNVPVPTRDGGVTFPGVQGILTDIFEDGLAIRSGSGTIVFPYERIAFVSAPSRITTPGSIKGVGA